MGKRVRQQRRSQFPMLLASARELAAYLFASAHRDAVGVKHGYEPDERRYYVRTPPNELTSSIRLSLVVARLSFSLRHPDGREDAG